MDLFIVYGGVVSAAIGFDRDTHADGAFGGPKLIAAIIFSHDAVKTVAVVAKLPSFGSPEASGRNAPLVRSLRYSMSTVPPKPADRQTIGKVLSWSTRSPPSGRIIKTYCAGLKDAWAVFPYVPMSG